jgi:hypothetical protein
MTTLFRRVKTALQDLNSIENDTETGAEVGSDSMNPVASTELLDELESLAHKAETDLQGKSSASRAHWKQTC